MTVRHFAAPSGKGPRKECKVVVGVTPLILRALKKMAADDRRTVSNLACKILTDHLRNHRYMTEEELRAEFLQSFDPAD